MRSAKFRGGLLAMAAVAILMNAQAAWAGGARFVAGQGWGTAAGSNVVWRTTVLHYFTDAGDLSANVPHAQADAMVAAAAAVWNAPTSSLSLAQGGQLAEHVSTANVTVSGTTVVFPADMQLANEANMPVAIVYDTDGSLIDMLLGTGASEPAGCEQNAVVGDVDDIHQSDSSIDHATLILNGRCVGSAPEQMTQMQYQLARAFGRVLGLTWSQTNDNVFTAQTTVTANQLTYWPLMHPIDVLCGNYSYQCMSNPFVLRVDDLNTLALLYPVPTSNVPAGKQATSNDAIWMTGIVYFPTGQGMDWVNVTTRRQNGGVTEDWQTTSALTGFNYQQALSTPVNNAAGINSGLASPSLDGYFWFRRVPTNGVSNLFFTTEAINPLYSGDAAVGAYVRTPPTPSGPAVTLTAWSVYSAGDNPLFVQMYANSAASSCNTGADGTEQSPASFSGTGWQNGLLCAWGHSSWWTMTVAAGHTWALEVTATDETGTATVNKALPTMGLWQTSDATGSAPTVGSQVAPFNSMVLGMTQMQMGSAGTDQSFRFAITDQYGAGRPDFTYVARVLYVAAVTPATVGASGGQIVITGTGFQQGNQVLVNGVAANVVSWSATQIVADVPSMVAVGTQTGVPVSVTVADPVTGGTALIPSAVTYLQLPDVMVLASVPAGVETGVAAAAPFAVRVFASDGLSPVANTAVTLAVSGGSAQLGACGNGTGCTVMTDANGIAQTTVTGGAVGLVTLTATEQSNGVHVQVVLTDTNPVRQAWFANTAHYVAAGASASWTVQFTALQDGVGAVNVPVVWSVNSAILQTNGNQLTGANGVANLVVNATAIPAGSVNTVTGCAWGVVCASWTVYGVDAAQWRVGAASGGAQSVPAAQALSNVVLAVTDLAGHPLEQAPVGVYQRVLAGAPACTTAECPAQAVLASSQTAATSDGNGSVTVAPLQLNNVPQTVQIAASSGTQGFVTVTLNVTP